jgi:uncharacterized protein (TIRG00374 family)
MSRRSLLIKLAVSASFLLLLGLNTNWSLFAERLRDVDFRFLLLSFFISLLMISSSCLKWELMLRLQGARPGFPFLMKTYFVGYFFTVLLPSTVGGDVARSYYCGKKVGNQYTAATSIFFERFSGLLLLLFFAVLTPFLRWEILSSWRIIIPMLGAALLLAILIAYSLSEKLLRGTGSLLQSFARFSRTHFEKNPLLSRTGISGKAIALGDIFSRKGGKFFHTVRETAGLFREQPAYLVWTVFLTLLFYAITWFNVFVAFRTFHIEVGMFQIVALLPIIMLVSMLPISVGGIGLAEGAYVFYFSLVGVPVESAFIMSIFLRFKLMVVACIGLLFYLTFRDRQRDYAEMLAGTAEAERE